MGNKEDKYAEIPHDDIGVTKKDTTGMCIDIPCERYEASVIKQFETHSAIYMGVPKAKTSVDLASSLKLIQMNKLDCPPSFTKSPNSNMITQEEVGTPPLKLTIMKKSEENKLSTDSVNCDKDEPKPSRVMKKTNSLPTKVVGKKSMGFLEEMFDIMERIGKGILGEVYKVRNKLTKQIMAIKLINKNKQREPSKNFIDKWDNLKLLSHDNIAKYYEFYQDNDCFYIGLECFEEGNIINNLIGSKKYKEVDIAKILYQLLLAVDYCHNKNILHMYFILHFII